MEGRLFVQTGEQAAGLAGQDFFDDLRGLADEEKGAGLADGQFDFMGRGLGEKVVNVIGVGQVGEKFLEGKILGGQHEGGELDLADFLGFEGFAGVNPFLLQGGEIGGELRGMVL